MPDFPIHDMKYLEKVDERNKVEDILRELNTGVSKIDFTKISEDEFASRTNPHFAKAIIKDVKERYSEIVKSGKKNIREFTLRGDSYYRFLFKPQEENIDILELSLKHENCDTKFDFGDESDGTQRLFDLLDIVFTSQPNSVYVVDELERSLHPVLTYKLIEILKEELQKKNIQLIFTTHETHIMDLKLFRKDEIWFMERDNKGLSRLYSLDIFKIRNEKIIKDGYINGLYGGIPLFKKLEE
jgi:AAA15 family ATPase/GTPase